MKQIITEQLETVTEEYPSHELDRSLAASEHNLTWHESRLTKQHRAGNKAQKPCVLWFTGLSGAGKSTIANLVEQELYARGKHTYLLDGDNVRHGLNRDVGFSDEDRIENLRRVSEVAWLMADAGMIVLVSFISPFLSERLMARELIGSEEFIEVYIRASLAVCEERDPKGIYRKARAGEIRNFTGIDSRYEEPENPELELDTESNSPSQLSLQLVDYLQAHRYI